MEINADSFTPTNADLIPTGQIAPVAGTPFDFRALKPIGRDICKADMPEGDQLVLAHGYDHNVGALGTTAAPESVLNTHHR